MKSIRLLRTGNWLTVDTRSPALRTALRVALTFSWVEFLQGQKKRQARSSGLSTVIEHAVEAFVDDHKGRISCAYGYLPRIRKVLARRGLTVREVNLTPPADPKVYEPQFDRIFEAGITLRHRQDEFLVNVAAEQNGRYDLPTGYGKSFTVGCIAITFPLARIAVISDSVTVIRDRIYPELCGMTGDVGICGGGERRRGCRVMCYTADSMHWLFRDSLEYGNFDFVIVDECHQAAADDFAYKLAQIQGQPRMIGLSATQDMRADKKDYRVEGAFGPIRMRMTYDEAREKGIVVPMEVKVRHVPPPEVDPAAGLKDEDMMRAAVWKYDPRNDLIVRDAVADVKAGYQVMIACTCLEHVLNVVRRFRRLKAKNPKLVGKLKLVPMYREFANEAEYQKKLKDMSQPRKGVGEVLASLPRMTRELRLRQTRKIESGEIRLFVCTTIFNVGFNPLHLDVVCRADAGGSEIGDHQLPGRASRTNKAGKKVGTVREYDDAHNPTLHGRFDRRVKTYKKLKWKIIRLVKPPGRLGKKMSWED